MRAHVHRLCSDPRNGDVFITGDNVVVRKYVHGGTKPIGFLQGPPGRRFLNGCSVNPVSGDLAVASGAYNGEVVIFPSAKGPGKVYALKSKLCWDVAYDSSGNLFADCQGRIDVPLALEELPKGQAAFFHVQMRRPPRPYPLKIQWDGGYLTFMPEAGGAIDQVQINGRVGKIVGSTSIDGSSGNYIYWIQNGAVLAWYDKIRKFNDQAIAVWNYPSGGNPIAKFYGVAKGDNVVRDITVSVAP